jgi:hypothetical protein
MRNACNRRLGVTLAVLLAWPQSAFAKQNFPPLVRDSYGLNAQPKCTLCHTGSPKVANANSKFLASLRATYPIIKDAATLKEALERAKLASADGDADGVTNVAELLGCADPNDQGSIPKPGSLACQFDSNAPPEPSPSSSSSSGDPAPTSSSSASSGSSGAPHLSNGGCQVASNLFSSASLAVIVTLGFLLRRRR